LEKSIDSIIKNAEKPESGADKKAQSIEIKAEVKGNAKEVKVGLPTESLKTIAENTNATVDVKTPNGNVAMPTEALAEIVKQAGGKDIQINVETKKAEDVKEAVTGKLAEALKDVPAKADGTKFDAKALENATAVEFNITAGDKAITSFGGNKLEVSVPVDKTKYEDGKYYRTFVLSKDGSVDATSGKIEGEAAKVGMGHFSTVIITTEEVSPFLDVQPNMWYADSAAKVYELGLINGVSDGIFDGGSNLSRAMLVTILFRMEGSPDMEKIDSFPDVKKGSWYEKAAIWAAENGIVKGADGLFLPDNNITREDTVTILQRYAKYKKKDVSKTADLSGYTDLDSIDVWAKDAVSWANAEGLLNGYEDKSIQPRGFITRAEAAVLLTRYIEKINK